METSVTKQVRYGRSCLRCKAYFVTEKEQARLCPWCDKVEMGLADLTEAFEPLEPGR